MRKNKSIVRWKRLLAAIVEQSGGTVTNKDNGCQLLQDWLDYVIAQQANAIAKQVEEGA